jgi:hypothetical protein
MKEMPKIFLSTLVIGLLALVPVSAHAQGQQPGNLTLSAPDTVKFGRSVTLTGRLTGPNNENRPVTLREDLFPFGAFADVGSATTNTQGEFSIVRTPNVNARYQANVPGEDSRIVTVGVSPSISVGLSDRTPRAGTRVRFFGRVCPEHDGASLKVQRRVSPNDWRTVAGTVLLDAPGTACSNYSRRVRVRRDGTYRTFLAAHDDHAAGTSRSRRIDVH